jgi:hypothetical protein
MRLLACLLIIVVLPFTASAQSAALIGSQEDYEADVHDMAVLQTTLYVSVSAEDIYGSSFVRDLVERQAEEMVDCSERLVNRQAKRMAEARTLIEAGKLPPEIWKDLTAEMKKRTDQAYVAIDRARVLRAVIETAKAEERKSFARGRGSVMEKFQGNGTFTPSDFRVVSTAFIKRFGKPIPISADGDTSLHRALGLDHRGRVDVAIRPDSAEGTWLRRYLEGLRIPYYAFRKAITGSATGPHIHIGPGSTRFARRRG